MNRVVEATIARLADSQPVSFGPLSHYNKLIGDDQPIFTGVQTCQAGYQTAPHWHPYEEYLFIIEGTAEAWLVAQPDKVMRLDAGDMIALPPETPHVFRNPGPSVLRLLGIHRSPTRIVHRLDPP